jgi:hypothetical protein
MGGAWIVPFEKVPQKAAESILHYEGLRSG